MGIREMKNKRLVRSKTDKMVGGVCGGLGAYLDFDPTLIRLIFVALAVFGAGSPVLLYLLMWIIIPAADSPRAMIGMNESPSEDRVPDTSLSVPTSEAQVVEKPDAEDLDAEEADSSDVVAEKRDETMAQTA